MASSFDDTLFQSLETLFQVFGQTDRGIIGLVDESNTLVPYCAKSRRDEIDDVRIHPRSGAKVIDNQEAILIAQRANGARFDPSRSSEGLQTFMLVLLINSEGGAIGVLQIETSNEMQQFREQHLELLRCVAEHASSAITKA